MTNEAQITGQQPNPAALQQPDDDVLDLETKTEKEDAPTTDTGEDKQTEKETKPFRVGAIREFDVDVVNNEAHAVVTIGFQGFPNNDAALTAYDDAGATVRQPVKVTFENNGDDSRTGTTVVQRERRWLAIYEACAIAGRLKANDTTRELDLKEVKNLRLKERLIAVANYSIGRVEVMQENQGSFDFLFESKVSITCKVTLPESTFFVTVAIPKDILETWRETYNVTIDRTDGATEDRTDTAWLIGKFNRHFLSAKNVVVVDAAGVDRELSDDNKQIFLDKFCSMLKANIYLGVLLFVEGK